MPPRDRVMTRLARSAARFPDLELDEFETTALPPRDAALARTIDAAVTRHWLALEAMLASRLARPWPSVQPELQAALLAGAAQLLLLDRIPDHAAIHESVEWVKHRLNPKAAGLANAVLRRIADLRIETIAVDPIPAAPLPPDVLPLGDGRARRLREPVFAADPLDRLAQQTSHPPELLAHWTAAHGHEAMTRLAMHSLVQAPILVTGLPEDAAMSGPQAADLEPHDDPAWRVFTGTHERLAALLREFRGARVQDPAAAAPVQATAALSPPPVIIIDACAGRGTKTSQLAALHPQAQIVATDIDPARLEVLSRTFAGHPRVAVVKPGDLAPFIGRADLLLLDVPCTNTGVLARRLEAKYRFTRQALARLVERQRQIAADHLALLKPDGRVLYATCSLEPAENEQQAQWLTRWHPMMVEARGFTQPAGLPGEAPSRYHDGGFFALLRRTDS